MVVHLDAIKVKVMGQSSWSGEKCW